MFVALLLRYDDDNVVYSLSTRSEYYEKSIWLYFIKET